MITLRPILAKPHITINQQSKLSAHVEQPHKKIKRKCVKHDCTVGLAEIGQNGTKSQKRSRTVAFLCKIEF